MDEQNDYAVLDIQEVGTDYNDYLSILREMQDSLSVDDFAADSLPTTATFENSDVAAAEYSLISADDLPEFDLPSNAVSEAETLPLPPVKNDFSMSLAVIENAPPILPDDDIFFAAQTPADEFAEPNAADQSPEVDLELESAAFDDFAEMSPILFDSSENINLEEPSFDGDLNDETAAELPVSFAFDLPADNSANENIEVEQPNFDDDPLSAELPQTLPVNAFDRSGELFDDSADFFAELHFAAPQSEDADSNGGVGNSFDFTDFALPENLHWSDAGDAALPEPELAAEENLLINADAEDAAENQSVTAETEFVSAANQPQSFIAPSFEEDEIDVQTFAPASELIDSGIDSTAAEIEPELHFSPENAEDVSAAFDFDSRISDVSADELPETTPLRQSSSESSENLELKAFLRSFTEDDIETAFVENQFGEQSDELAEAAMLSEIEFLEVEMPPEIEEAPESLTEILPESEFIFAAADVSEPIPNVSSNHLAEVAAFAPQSAMTAAQISPFLEDRFIIFKLDNELFAFAAEHVAEIGQSLPITPLPFVPSWFLGISNLRGDILSIIGLRELWGKTSVALPKTKLLVIRSRKSDLVVGLMVDAVREMRRVAPPDISFDHAQADSALSPYYLGSVSENGQKLNLLDVEKFLETLK